MLGSAEGVELTLSSIARRIQREQRWHLVKNLCGRERVVAVWHATIGEGEWRNVVERSGVTEAFVCLLPLIRQMKPDGGFMNPMSARRVLSRNSFSLEELQIHTGYREECRTGERDKET